VATTAEGIEEAVLVGSDGCESDEGGGGGGIGGERRAMAKEETRGVAGRWRR